jgi:hypothetical protein
VGGTAATVAACQSATPGASLLNDVAHSPAMPRTSTTPTPRSCTGSRSDRIGTTGASEQIDVDGHVPRAAGLLDGLLLAGRDVWVVENLPNTLRACRLALTARAARLRRHRFAVRPQGDPRG